MSIEPLHVSTILVGVDGSENSTAAVRWAASMARLAGAEVVAVHAIDYPWIEAAGLYAAPPVEEDPEWRAWVKDQMEGVWCEPLRQAGVRYRTVIADGRPATVIAETAEAQDADLVVLGRRGRGEVAEVLLGSVSREVSHHCHRPLVLISPPHHHHAAAEAGARTASRP